MVFGLDFGVSIVRDESRGALALQYLACVIFTNDVCLWGLELVRRASRSSGQRRSCHPVSGLLLRLPPAQQALRLFIALLRTNTRRMLFSMVLVCCLLCSHLALCPPPVGGLSPQFFHGCRRNRAISQWALHHHPQYNNAREICAVLSSFPELGLFRSLCTAQ